jgi:hypothetical protein
MTIWTDDRLDAPTIAGGLPTSEKRFEFTLSAAVPASGMVNAQPGIAVGEIIVHNTCDRNYSSSAGIQVGTDENFETGVNFITLEDISLPSDEQIAVRIEAVNGGESGNLPAGSIHFVEYPESLCLEIHQDQPTYGGNSGSYRSPSEEDQAAALNLINDQIQDAAASALANDPEGQDLIPLGDAVVTAVKNIQMTPDQGYAADELLMRETVEVAYKTIRRSDMEAIIRGQSSRMNMQTAGFIGYEILSGPVEENGLMTWAVKADFLVYEPQTNEQALQIMLRGQTLDHAKSILNTLDHIKSFHIQLLPSKLNRMPLTAQNIQIVIHEATEEEKP